MNPFARTRSGRLATRFSLALAAAALAMSALVVPSAPAAAAPVAPAETVQKPSDPKPQPKPEPKLSAVDVVPLADLQVRFLSLGLDVNGDVNKRRFTFRITNLGPDGVKFRTWKLCRWKDASGPGGHASGPKEWYTLKGQGTGTSVDLSVVCSKTDQGDQFYEAEVEIIEVVGIDPNEANNQAAVDWNGTPQ